MTLTAPGSLSNSGSKPFSNLFGRIAMNNHNILLGSQSQYDWEMANKPIKCSKKSKNDKQKKSKSKCGCKH